MTETTEVTLDWWIATDWLKHGGQKILGPFVSQELAMTVRTYVEWAHKTEAYFVDSEPRP